MASVGRIGDDEMVRRPVPLQIVRPDERRARLVRFRAWLASAMWVPVLAANVLAIELHRHRPGPTILAGGDRESRVDESQRGRVELSRLLDEQLAAGFPDPDEREIAGRPDRLGLGSVA
jgi:hypothetical protein